MNLKIYLSQERGRGSKLAEDLGVTPTTVSEWAAAKKSVPAERCPAIERATDGRVRCEDLRPDVDWAYLRGAGCGTTQHPQEAA